jgi:hypothetical protein
LSTIDPNCAGQLLRRYREPKFSRRLFIGGAAVCNRAAVTIGVCLAFRKARETPTLQKYYMARPN